MIQASAGRSGADCPASTPGLEHFLVPWPWANGLTSQLCIRVLTCKLCLIITELSEACEAIVVIRLADSYKMFSSVPDVVTNRDTFHLRLAGPDWTESLLECLLLGLLFFELGDLNFFFTPKNVAQPGKEGRACVCTHACTLGAPHSTERVLGHLATGLRERKWCFS